MRASSIFGFWLLLAATTLPASQTVLVIHGGAGALSKEKIGEVREAEIRQTLRSVAEAGRDQLAAGRPAVEVVAEVVRQLEDSPLFNAGRGAVLNAEGYAELDAAIMDGATRNVGAVAAVHRTRNPILLARAVMDDPDIVMLAGPGADAFGKSKRIPQVSREWFRTPQRVEDWKSARAVRSSAVSGPERNIGTVGAVALDRNGKLAAATSTGGRTNKPVGRIGDAPIIGAGTWADARCGVSATGWGEYFIRLAVAHEICARVAYRGEGVEPAARGVLDEVKALGGDGGVIVLDADGNAALPYNTGGMYRAQVRTDGTVDVAIWEE
jgi:beta-aspartyl-peptidase (threonine type)